MKESEKNKLSEQSEEDQHSQQKVEMCAQEVVKYSPSGSQIFEANKNASKPTSTPEDATFQVVTPIQSAMKNKNKRRLEVPNRGVNK